MLYSNFVIEAHNQPIETETETETVHDYVSYILPLYNSYPVLLLV